MEESRENYLETILVLTQQMDQVRSIDIVNALHFTKPSVSIALKKLKEAGYVTVDSGGYITLTSLGLTKAEGVLERHRVLTKVLIQLGVSEETAKADACRIEHHISDESFTMIKKHIGL